MELGSKAKAFVFGLIALFAALMVLVVTASHFNTSATEQEGELERVLHTFAANDLTAAGVVLADVYGPEYSAAAVICPNETVPQIENRLGISVDTLHLPESGVPAKYNYLVLAGQETDLKFERFNIEDVNLCQTEQPGATYNAYTFMSFVRDTEHHTWLLIG